MRPAEFVEKQIRKLQYKTTAETHEKVFNNVLQAMDEFEKKKAGAAAPDVRRIIMKNSITKLAVAAMINRYSCSLSIFRSFLNYRQLKLGKADTQISVPYQGYKINFRN